MYNINNLSSETMINGSLTETKSLRKYYMHIKETSLVAKVIYLTSMLRFSLYIKLVTKEYTFIR